MPYYAHGGKSKKNGWGGRWQSVRTRERERVRGDGKIVRTRERESARVGSGYKGLFASIRLSNLINYWDLK